MNNNLSCLDHRHGAQRLMPSQLRRPSGRRQRTAKRFLFSFLLLLFHDSFYQCSDVVAAVRPFIREISGGASSSTTTSSSFNLPRDKHPTQVIGYGSKRRRFHSRFLSTMGQNNHSTTATNDAPLWLWLEDPTLQRHHQHPLRLFAQPEWTLSLPPSTNYNSVNVTLGLKESSPSATTNSAVARTTLELKPARRPPGSAIKVPILGLWGIYTIPSGQLWVWMVDSEVVVDGPGFQIHKVKHLLITRLTPTTSEQSKSKRGHGRKHRRHRHHHTVVPTSAEERRQVQLLRRALKDHDWYYSTGPVWPDLTHSLQRQLLFQQQRARLSSTVPEVSNETTTASTDDASATTHRSGFFTWWNRTTTWIAREEPAPSTLQSPTRSTLR